MDEWCKIGEFWARNGQETVVGKWRLGADGSYPTFEQMLYEYRDRMTTMLSERLEGGEAVAEGEATVGAVETYLHTYGIIHEHWHIEDWIQVGPILLQFDL